MAQHVVPPTLGLARVSSYISLPRPESEAGEFDWTAFEQPPNEDESYKGFTEWEGDKDMDDESLFLNYDESRPNTRSVKEKPADVGGVLETEVDSFSYGGQPLQFIDTNMIFNQVGSGIRFFTVEEGTRFHLWSLGVGVDTTAAHAATKKIAYAEKGISPSIHLLSYPDCRKLVTLKGVSELEHIHLCFSRDGNRLFSLGGVPDYKLAVWDVSTGEILGSVPTTSRNTNPPQMVSSDPLDPNSVCTGGGGSISFWYLSSKGQRYVLGSHEDRKKEPPISIARSSTRDRLSHTRLGAGVKRPSQSNTNKSTSRRYTSNIQLDTRFQAPIIEEPDTTQDYGFHCWDTEHHVYVGSTGSEGKLYLFHPPETTPQKSWIICEGSSVSGIVVCKLCVVVAFENGTISWVSRSDHTILNTFKLMDGLSVSCLCPDPPYRRLLIGTRNGSIHYMPLVCPDSSTDKSIAQQIGDYHYAPITGLTTLPRQHILVSCSQDGTMRVWDYRDKVQPCISITTTKTQFTAICCSLTSNLVALGSHTGVLRVYEIRDGRIPPVLIFRRRIHSGSISHISFHPNQLFLATSSGSEVCFLNATTPNFSVIGFVSVKSTVLSLFWYKAEDDSNSYIFISAEGGNIFRLLAPDGRLQLQQLEENTDNIDDYGLSNRDVQKSLVKIAHTASGIAIDPRSFGHAKQSFFALTSDKYLKRFGFPEHTGDPDLMDDSDLSQPKEEFRCHDKPGTALLISPDSKWLGTGGGDGVALLRMVEHPKRVFTYSGHDAFTGGVSYLCFSFDSQFLLTAGHGPNGAEIICHTVKGFDWREAAQESEAPKPFADLTENLEAVTEIDDVDSEPSVQTVQESIRKTNQEAIHAANRKKITDSLERIRARYDQFLEINQGSPAVRLILCDPTCDEFSVILKSKPNKATIHLPNAKYKDIIRIHRLFVPQGNGICSGTVNSSGGLHWVLLRDKGNDTFTRRISSISYTYDKYYDSQKAISLLDWFVNTQPGLPTKPPLPTTTFDRFQLDKVYSFLAMIINIQKFDQTETNKCRWELLVWNGTGPTHGGGSFLDWDRVLGQYRARIPEVIPPPELARGQLLPHCVGSLLLVAIWKEELFELLERVQNGHWYLFSFFKTHEYLGQLELRSLNASSSLEEIDSGDCAILELQRLHEEEVAKETDRVAKIIAKEIDSRNPQINCDPILQVTTCSEVGSTFRIQGRCISFYPNVPADFIFWFCPRCKWQPIEGTPHECAMDLSLDCYFSLVLEDNTGTISVAFSGTNAARFLEIPRLLDLKTDRDAEEKVINMMCDLLEGDRWLDLYIYSHSPAVGAVQYYGIGPKMDSTN